MTQPNISTDDLIFQPILVEKETRPASSKTSHEPEFSGFQENSFVIENSFYRSRLPRATHWSIAWSDLMMTMFILFLSMFIYQAAHKDFLVSNTPEIIGGSTSEALDIEGDQDFIVPIVPLSQTAPLITSGTVMMVEKISPGELEINEEFQEKLTNPPTDKDFTKEISTSQETEEQALSPVISEKIEAPKITVTEDIIEPAPILPPEEVADTFNKIYNKSQQTLNEFQLDKFASIELIPDKTMRIILTGDLLFTIGQAELSKRAKESLNKIATVIKDTPYMINVVGHTDNSPMHSSKFASNWELSVIRASSVARFLINTIHMNPQQFIVSGYGSQRPIKVNTNASNRAANRRVEIIVSKRLAPAMKATQENLLE